MLFGNHHTNAKQPRGRDRVTTTATTTNSYYTLTEVRTHNTMESAWVLIGNTIYDVTTYISDHPGGASSILRKCGGSVDCTRDFNFHSKRARREWKRYKVGILLTTWEEKNTNTPTLCIILCICCNVRWLIRILCANRLKYIHIVIYISSILNDPQTFIICVYLYI